jgi:primosomal replication protein N
VNRVELTACIVEVNALRYTPAGLPALDLRLEHESSVEEAGQARQVKAAVKAVALGSIAERIGKQHVVLHIQEFQQD